MATVMKSVKSPGIRFEFVNWLATSALPRDQQQSRRLHEPDHRINTIDPMTGADIHAIEQHPFLVDGNLTVYFETAETRKAYLAMPVNHPCQHLPFAVNDTAERGG